MPPKYTLKYFNVSGLAEPIRYLFSYGNIDFEDQRIEYERWKEYKESTPFGQVPVLKVDGKTVNQSVAICRYLAKQLNLVGKSDWEALEIDMIVDTIGDFRQNYSGYFREQNEEVKAKKLQDIKTINNPYYLAKFEEIVKRNGGYFVGEQLTWADIYFASLAELWSNVVKEQLLTGYPALNALKEKVDNLPGIKEYRERRPKTVF